MPDLHALVLACTLKPSPAPSSAVLLGEQVLAALDETPEKTDATTRTAAANAVHLARLLQGSAYPPPEA
jgi:hypothetical protein